MIIQIVDLLRINPPQSNSNSLASKNQSGLSHEMYSKSFYRSLETNNQKLVTILQQGYKKIDPALRTSLCRDANFRDN
ncbi:MAG: hypothetical protein Kow0029_30880 [Candidatus Rifleibacteriota bacterium]